MKTRVFGYPSADPRNDEGEVLLAGITVPASEQIRIFHESKLHNRYPEGINRVTHEGQHLLGTAIRIQTTDSNPTSTTKKKSK